MKSNLLAKKLEKRRRSFLKEVALREFSACANGTFANWFNCEPVLTCNETNTNFMLRNYASCLDLERVFDIIEPRYHDVEYHYRDFDHCLNSTQIKLPIQFLSIVEESEWLKFPSTLNMLSKASNKRELIQGILINRGSNFSRRLIALRKHKKAQGRDVVNWNNVSIVKKYRQMPLTPDNFKYDRCIGVEIECGVGGSLGDKLPLWAREKGDGSIQLPNAIEFNLLVKRSELEMRLSRFTNLIKGTHKVNRSCGLHVHLDVRGKTEDDVYKLAKKLNAWLYALREFVPESRRGVNGENNFCKFGVTKNENDRYHAVNFASFRRYRSLEIRLHSGTTDYTKIISWIRLLEVLMVIKAPAKNVEGINALALVPLCEYEKSYWLKRHQELNPRLYTSTTPATENESTND